MDILLASKKSTQTADNKIKCIKSEFHEKSIVLIYLISQVKASKVKKGICYYCVI